MKLTTRIKSLILTPPGDPIFSERAIEVSIDDEAAGEFVKIHQEIDGKKGVIGVDHEEWPALKDAVERIFGEIEKRKGGGK